MRPLAALALLLLAVIAIRRRIRQVGAALSIDDTDWCQPDPRLVSLWDRAHG